MEQYIIGIIAIIILVIIYLIVRQNLAKMKDLKILCFKLPIFVCGFFFQNLVYSSKENIAITNSFINESVKKTDEISLEETKEFIVDYINKYAFSSSGIIRKFKAEFIDSNHLRIAELNDSEQKELIAKIYDFKVVFQSQEVNLKLNNVAIISHEVLVMSNVNKKKWKKGLFELRIEGHEYARSLNKAVLHLNQLLIENSKDKF